MTLNYPDSNVTAELIRTDVTVNLLVFTQGTNKVTLTRQDAWDSLIKFLSVTDEKNSPEATDQTEA